MSKTEYLLFLLILIPLTIRSQDFSKAPAGGVKTIVEWVQRSGNSAISKGYVYRFLPDGKLKSYRNESLKEEYQVEYDQRGRIARTVSIYGLNSSITRYTYKKGYTVLEEEYKGNYTRTLLFYENGKLVEKKSFYKNSETLGNYKVFERIVYHYNKRDSLMGEMYYNYYEDEDEHSPFSRKTLHRYNDLTNQKTNITEYGYDRKWQISTDFTYTKDGKLRKKTTSFREGGQQIIRYEYKDGKLWQEYLTEGPASTVIVYKNGRPVRKKSKEGREWETVDYQYEFY